ncbi:MAG TPA: NAD(P)-dependent oxidoreductase, partial [Armatimonadota bacterium]
MQHAFITGAAGFIGSYAVREFVEQGWHVFAMVHKKSSRILEELAASGSVTIIKGDLDDFEALSQSLEAAVAQHGADLEAIVHCAGRASDVGRRDEFRRANFESVQNLCGMTERLNVNRFVFVSTTDVYGLRDFSGESENELASQDNIRNPYPEFKIAAEERIRNTLPPERYSIIRPAAVWGVGDPTLTPRAVSFLKSSPWIIHFGKWHGSNRWPLAHVRNVAAAIFLAATVREAEGSAINVLDSEVTSMDDFYRMLASIYIPDKKLTSVTLPMWFGRAVGTVISSVSNILNLDHPFTDPSLYALYSVTSNLDFSNETLLRLFKASG